ncbi:MAG: FAD-binding oxidoreductase, partial [Rhodobacteraceae bacterium]|nr:FAD-binding oxidoreductase [Paracoccaceae bacterium]
MKRGDQEPQDVVVIGGAVMGASVAYWLTRMQPGLKVLVVERDPTYARASTALSAAGIRQQFTNPVNVEISRFGIGFIKDFQTQLGHDVGIPTLGLRENGYLFLAQTTEGAATLADVAQMQRSHGAATEIWTPDQVKARFPWLEVGDLTAASFGPRDEWFFDNMGLLAGFRAAARAQGARFITDEVVGITTQSGR